MEFSIGVAEQPYGESHGRPRVAEDFYVHSRTSQTPSLTAAIELLKSDNRDTDPRSLSVARDGDRLYVGSVDRLEVFDVSNEASPSRIGTFDLPRGGEIWDIELRGDTAYVTATHSGLQVLDVADPGNIQAYQHDADIQLAVDVEVAGGVAYVTDFHNGVVALDVSDLDNIRELDRVATAESGQGQAWQLVRDRDRLLVSEATRGVVSVDISDPADLGNPQRVIAGSATALDLHDQTLFVLDQQGTVSALDVANPAAPELLDSLTVQGAAGILQHEYGNLLVGTLDGLSVIDASDPRNLSESYTYQLPDTGGQAELYGETLYVPGPLVLAMPAQPVLGVSLQQPDLVIDDTDFPANSYQAGDALAIRGMLRNAGNSSSGEFDLEIRLSQDRIYGNTDDVVIHSGSVDPLAPQDSRPFEVNGQIPRTATPGPYYLIVRADSGQSVEEIDETNNDFWSAGRGVTIGAGAALVPAADTFQMNEDDELRFSADDLLDNDWSESGTLDLVAVDETDQTHGTITEQSDGEFVYQPEADYAGLAEFEYVVSDGAGERAVGLVSVEIAGVNDAPVAEDVQLYNPSGETLRIELPARDVETPLEELTVEILDGPEFGELTTEEDGTLVYQPQEGLYVDDTIRYRVTDPEGLSDTGTISISMAHVIHNRGRLAVPGTNAVVMVGNVDRALIYPDDTHDIGRISLIGATRRSALVVAGRPGQTIGQIHADGPVRLIKAPGSTLVGNGQSPSVDVAGPVQVMVLGNVDRGEQQILLNTDDMAQGRDRTALVFGDVTDASLDTGGVPVKFLRAQSWRDTADSPANTIAAPHAGTVLVLGPLEAGLEFSGSDAQGYSLGKLVTLGAVSGAQMSMPGDAGVVIAGNWQNSTLQADSLGRFISRQGLSGALDLNGQDRWDRSLGLMYVVDDVSGGTVT
ncbi:MAG: tandem-95 repeat protein, partial [Jiangellaceae bacterium]